MFITIEDETGRADTLRKTPADRSRIVDDGDQWPDPTGREGRPSCCPAVVRLVSSDLAALLIVTNSSSERRRGQRVRALLTKPTPRFGVRLFDALRAKDVRVVGSSPFKAVTCYRSKLYCRQAICTTHGIPAGGLWLVEVARREHVEQLVLDDPFWPTGLRRDVRILAWHRVFADSMRLKAQGVR